MSARSQFMIQVQCLALPHFAIASEAELGAWLRVHCYAAEHLTGGRIHGARKWNLRQWQSALRVSLKAIEKAVTAGLMEWVDDDLILHEFDLDGEILFLNKSAGGVKGAEIRRKNAELRARTPSGTPNGNHHTPSPPSPPSPPIPTGRPLQAGPVQPSPPIPPSERKADPTALAPLWGARQETKPKGQTQTPEEEIAAATARALAMRAEREAYMGHADGAPP